MLGQALVERLPPTDWRVIDSRQDRSDRVRFVGHTPPSLCILPGILCNFLTSTVKVSPLRYVTAVGKSDMEDRIGIDVRQPVIPQLQLVVAQHRVGLNKKVNDRARVVVEPA